MNLLPLTLLLSLLPALSLAAPGTPLENRSILLEKRCVPEGGNHKPRKHFPPFPSFLYIEKPKKKTSGKEGPVN